MCSTMEEAASNSQPRDQNYQNPLNLLHDDAFVSAILILCFIAFLEVVIGFFYSTYCSYPSMMHSETNRRRLQYCAMAGGLGRYQQTVYDHTIRSQDEEVKVPRKVDAIREEESVLEDQHPSSPNRTRRNSMDIQSVLSSILSECEDENDVVSLASNDESLFGEDFVVGAESRNGFSFDRNDKSGRGSRNFQHARVLTQTSSGGGSRGQSKKAEMEMNKYSAV